MKSDVDRSPSCSSSKLPDSAAAISPEEEKYSLSVPYLKSLALDVLCIWKYLHLIRTYLGDGAEV